MKIFFSGIGGSGVSAIAGFMADKGHSVVGSDRAFDRNPAHPVLRLLKSKGIRIVPQDGSGIDKSYDFAVFSTAVEPDQPEAVKAKSLGVPVKTRPEYLAELVSGFKTIVVAGTSGKSTTSGLLAFLMRRLGLKPNFIGGGRVKQFKTADNPGNSITGDSDTLVVEACESDGTIINYKPQHSVILNLAFDHHSIDRTFEMFEVLINNTPGKIILNADDDNLVKIIRIPDNICHSALDALPPPASCGRVRGNDNVITFSIDNPSDYRAVNIVYKPFSTYFLINPPIPPLQKGGEGGFIKLKLSLPGKYNLYNALSCIAVLCETGVPLEDIAGVLHEFKGIERRFDIHFDDGKRLVVDDYAHNPHKISSLMETVRDIRGNICYIFQPHGFAPTRMMKKEYIEAFSNNLRSTDHLILLPIFYAGGAVSRDISSRDLADGIIAAGKSVEVAEDRQYILDRVNERDNYVILGARDDTLADLARDIANILRR